MGLSGITGLTGLSGIYGFVLVVFVLAGQLWGDEPDCSGLIAAVL